MFSYVERGRYGAQLAHTLALFPAEQILLLRSDDLMRDHQAVLARISAFCGIAPFAELPVRRDHARPGIDYPGWPSEADRELVLAELGTDLAYFRRLSGLNITIGPLLAPSSILPGHSVLEPA